MRPYLAYISLILLTLNLRYLFKTGKARLAVYAVTGLVMAWLLWTFTYPRAVFNDFNIAYYPAGRAVWDSPDTLYFSDARQSVRGFVNIPIVAVLFTPLSYLSRPAAQWVFTGIGTCAVLVFLMRMVKFTRAEGEKRYLLFALAAMNGPLFYSLRLGNTTHFMLLLLFAAFLLLKEKRDLAAGFLFAIVVLIKIPFLLLPLYFGVRNRSKLLFSFIVSVLFITAVSIALFGLPLHIEWYSRCVQPFLAKPLAAFNNQSVDGFLARLFSSGNAVDWQPVEMNAAFTIARYALIALLLAAFFIAFRDRRRDINLEFCALLCLSLLIGPISWIHYYLVLLLPVCFLVTGVIRLKTEKRMLVLLILSIGLSFAPVRIEMAYFTGNQALKFLMTKFAVSHYFFGALLFFLILLRSNVEAYQKDQSAEKLIRH